MHRKCSVFVICREKCVLYNKVICYVAAFGICLGEIPSHTTLNFHNVHFLLPCAFYQRWYMAPRSDGFVERRLLLWAHNFSND
jgi:hypothetical protein